MESPIVDDAALRIVARPGQTDVAVVSFSGIEQAFGGVPQEEFVKTLSDSAHSHFFVVDKQCTWYNATAATIVRTLEPRLRPFRKVVTLGNSMGGFGAIYFASRLPNCRTAIAFVPQFSVDPAIVPEETRWKAHRARLTAWPVRHAMCGARDDGVVHLFFGRRDARDQAHLALFRKHATPGTDIFSLNDATHDVAKYLRSRNLLRPVLDAVVLDDTANIGALLAESGVPHDCWRPPGA